ncbi:hypothetical protein CR513_33634, partial [Mucuna pruriens]
MVKCGNYMIARVLIDNGSSLNVMPKATLDKLYGLDATLKNSPIVVRAFDGSKREVMGKITLPIRIGPIIFDITFQVKDIQPTYSCLLGRPWIHAIEAVPSSLHQKVNTKSEGGSLKPSKAAIMVAKVLIDHGYQPGKGLGKGLEGITKLVRFQENLGRSELGYTGATKGESTQKTQRIQLDLYLYFINRGIVSRDQITMIESQPLVQAEWVKPMKGTLTNWTIEALPKLIGNATLELDNANESSRQDEEEGPKEEALVELERLLEQEGPKLQSGAEELEIINLGEEGESRGIKVPSNLKQRLVALLKEYADVFAWSYRDMLDLDTTIVEHKLPLLLDAIWVRQQLRRMKPEVALKIKEEVEKQWNLGFLAVAEYP